ncbi:MAG: PIN domain-containing protein [Chthoniobacteraceae bacterium]
METPRTNYILIDHENIHSLDPGEIAGLPVKVLVFLGEQTTRMPVEDVKRLLMHAGQIELITISGHGKNALDFHIAFYAGRISSEDARASIHIISRDKGFDPLIAHLNSRNVKAERSEKVPVLGGRRKAEGAPVPADARVERVIGHLTKIAKGRPRKRKTLASSLVALFGRQLTDGEVSQVIAALEQAGKLAIDEKGTVTYQI